MIMQPQEVTIAKEKIKLCLRHSSISVTNTWIQYHSYYLIDKNKNENYDDENNDNYTNG